MRLNRFITVFACDICKESRFHSFEEAEEHEKNCTGPKTNNSSSDNIATAMDVENAPPTTGRRPIPLSTTTGASPAVAVAAALPSSTSAATATASSTKPPSAAAAAISSAPSSSSSTNNHPPSDGLINTTLFKCRKCKLLFWTTHKAALHEQSCHEPQWYNCSVCQVLRFRSREERTVHERTCSGPMPLRMADLPLADRVNNAGGGRGGGGGDGTASVGATTAGSKAGSAVERVERAASAAGSFGGDQKKKEHVKIGAVIDKFRDQVRHGTSTTEARVEAPVVFSPAAQPTSSSGAADDEGSDSSVEIIEISKPVAAQPKSPSSDGGTIKQKNVPAKNDNEDTETPKKKGGPMEWTTVWTCDVCKHEQFDCFEDAVAHEKKCQAKQEAMKNKKAQDPSPAVKEVAKNAVKSAPATAAPTTPTKPSPLPKKKSSPSPKKLTANKPLTLFSPILKDASDSSNLSQISKYHRLILKSLQLLHLPPTASGGRTVSFQCQFCSHSFPPNESTKVGGQWTLKSIVETLPSMVMTHIMSNGCKAVPADVGTQLPMAKLSGKMPFDEFLSGFFSENGIVERPNGRGVVMLSDEEFGKMPGSEKSKRGKQVTGSSSKKRGRPFGSKSTTAKRQKAPKAAEPPHRPKHNKIKYGDMGCKMHNEQGTQFCLGPLDGIPFLSSFSQEASKKLHSSEKFLLQQLELFTLSPKLVEPEKMNAPPQSVGIRCRNCIADKNGCCFVKLSSVNNMSRDLLLMALDHVISCRFIKAKDVKVLQELKGRDRDCLAKYCSWIAKLYCLKDSKSGDGSHLAVVWGDSPKVSGEYCSPEDVDVSLLLDVPNLEAETPPANVGEEVVEEARSMAVAPSSSKNNSSLDVSTLTHYHYLILMEFVIVPSRRQLNSAGDGSKRESQEDSQSPLITASFKCKHCNKIIGSPTSLEQMTDLLLDLPSHTECCSLVPSAKKEELTKYKGALSFTSEDQQGTQQSNTAGNDRYVQYARELCTKVYGMVDVHDPNDGTSYVSFSSMDELNAKYGKKYAGSSNGVFSLPMIEKLF